MNRSNDMFAAGAFERCLAKMQAKQEDYAKAIAFTKISNDETQLKEIRELAKQKVDALIIKYLEEPISRAPEFKWVKGVKVRVR